MPSLTDRLKVIIRKFSARAPPRQVIQPAGSMAAQVMSSLGVPNPKNLRQAYLNNLIASYWPVPVSNLSYYTN
jgi:hypothetical protein